MDLTPRSAGAKHQPHEKHHCADRTKALQSCILPRLYLLLLSRDSQPKTVSGQYPDLPS